MKRTELRCWVRLLMIIELDGVDPGKFVWILNYDGMPITADYMCGS